MSLLAQPVKKGGPPGQPATQDAPSGGAGKRRAPAVGHVHKAQHGRQIRRVSGIAEARGEPAKYKRHGQRKTNRQRP